MEDWDVNSTGGVFLNFLFNQLHHFWTVALFRARISGIRTGVFHRYSLSGRMLR